MKKLLLLILIFVAWANVKAQDYSDYTSCAEQDSLALVAFYYATDGANWLSNQDGFSIDNLGDDVLTYYSTDYPNAGLGKWLEGPVKDWFGVTLEKQLADNGVDYEWRVIHLHPTVNRRSSGENNLTGYVPREVGMLTALEWFKVNGNSGLGDSELPDEIYQPNMEEFDVEAAYFDGVVSDELTQCSQLTFLNLRYNDFDSIPVCNFFDEEPFKENFTNSGNVRMFFYNNHLPWATLEPTVEYLVSVDGVYEARNQTTTGRAQEIVVTEGESITLTCSDAGENGTCTWYKKGFCTYLTGTTYTIDNVAAADTGNYTVLTTNTLVQENDANSDYSNTFTKPIHVTFIPSIPTFEKANSTNDGESIVLEFSKPMAVPTSDQVSQFAVSSNGQSYTISSITRGGRLNNRYTLQLSSALTKDATVEVSYTAGSITCSNGGSLASFSNEVVNKTGLQPSLVSAETRTDGYGIILEFDYFIDPDRFSAADFIVNSPSDITVTEVQLMDGEVNDDISKKILLVLSSALDYTNDITISANNNALYGLYGSGIEAFSNVAVTNNVSTEMYDVTLSVIDGTEALTSLSIQGDLSVNALTLYDDGTHGDATADDHTWTYQLSLAAGDYNWDVYSEITKIGYDTTEVKMSNGTTAEQITPYTYTEDSVLTDGYNLAFTVASSGISGDTNFGYQNLSLTLILDLTSYFAEYPEASADPYVMGIDDDWTEGIALVSTGEDDLYTLTLDGYSLNETVSFCFKNGDVWENGSLKLREVTLTENTTITVSFGDLNTATSIDEPLDSSDIMVYPNPFTNAIHITDLPESDHLNIQVMDITGRVLYQGNNSSDIELSNLAQGMYLLYIQNNGQTIYTTKIIKH